MEIRAAVLPFPRLEAPIVRLRADTRGLLHLLVAVHDPDARRHRWEGLASAGLGDLHYQAGTFVHGPDETPEDRLALCALGPQSRPAPAHGSPGARTLIGQARAWTGPAKTSFERFVQTCGGEAILLARLGIPGPMPSGRPGSVEAIGLLVDRFPALGGLVAHAIARGLPGTGDALDRLLVPDLPPDALGEAILAFAESCVHDLPAPRGELGVHLPFPAPARPTLRRLVGALEGIDLPARQLAVALWLLPLAPRDWLPRDAGGFAAMGIVLEAAASLVAVSEGALDLAPLIEPVAGDWARAAAQLDRHAHTARQNPQGWALQVRDMTAAFHAQVLRPAAAYARAATRLEGGLPDMPAAWRMLFAGKGLAAVAEADSDWHARGAAMTEMVSTLSGLRRDTWRRPFPDFAASNGRAVVPILSTADLVEEGRAMRHCVGSYAPGCARGAYAVASVRHPDGARSSTVQLSRGLDRALQHHAAGNAKPAREDAEAVRELLAALAAKRQALPRRGLGRRLVEAASGGWRRLADAAAPRWLREGGHPYNPSDPVRVLRAASLWERYLPRPARGSLPALLQGVEPALAGRLARLGPPRRVSTPSEVLRATALGIVRRWRSQHLITQAFWVALVAGSWLAHGVYLDIAEAERAAQAEKALTDRRQVEIVRRTLIALGESMAGKRDIPPDVLKALHANLGAQNALLPDGVRLAEPYTALRVVAGQIKAGATDPKVPGFPPAPASAPAR